MCTACHSEQLVCSYNETAIKGVLCASIKRFLKNNS